MKVVFQKGARAPSHVCWGNYWVPTHLERCGASLRGSTGDPEKLADLERRKRAAVEAEDFQQAAHLKEPGDSAEQTSDLVGKNTRFHHSTQKGEGKTGDFGCDVGPCLGNSCYFMLGHVLESGPFGVWVGDEPEVSLTHKDTKLPPGGDTAPQGRGNNAAAWRRRSAVFCCLPPCK